MSDLDVLAAERDDYYDQLLRTRADFDNFRKRMIKQQTEHLERANEGLIVKLLEVLDVLDGATRPRRGLRAGGRPPGGRPGEGGARAHRPRGPGVRPQRGRRGGPRAGRPATAAARWCRRCCAPATAGRVGSCVRRW